MGANGHEERLTDRYPVSAQGTLRTESHPGFLKRRLGRGVLDIELVELSVTGAALLVRSASGTSELHVGRSFDVVIADCPGRVKIRHRRPHGAHLRLGVELAWISEPLQQYLYTLLEEHRGGTDLLRRWEAAR